MDEKRHNASDVNTITLAVDEDEFSAALAHELAIGGLSVVDATERLFEDYLCSSLQKELATILLKPPIACIHKTYFKGGRFATLKTLAESGYETWYPELTFITKHKDSLSELAIQAHGFHLVPIEYGYGVMRDIWYKRKTLKKQSNHYIRLNHVILPISIFQSARNRLLAEDKQLLQPYIANLSVGANFPGFPMVSFDHLLTGERLFCTCALPAHDKMLKIAKNKTSSYAKGSWPYKLIHFLTGAKYQSGICHLCIASAFGVEVARKYYGDAIQTHYEAYVRQLVLVDDLDEKTAKADVQQRLGISRWAREAELYRVVKEIFPNLRVLRETSPIWLGRQRLDIYIPDANLAIEHQGQQHFQAIDVFGGNLAFARTIERDRQKRDLCNLNGVTIIEVRFDEPLTLPSIRNRLRRHLQK